MRPIDFEDGVQATPGETGAYPGVPEGGLEKLPAEGASVAIIVARLPAWYLVEVGLIPSAGIVEVGSQDPAIADENSISEPLLIKETIAVAVSKVDKEVDVARKNIGESEGQVVVYPLVGSALVKGTPDGSLRRGGGYEFRFGIDARDPAPRRSADGQDPSLFVMTANLLQARRLFEEVKLQTFAVLELSEIPVGFSCRSQGSRLTGIDSVFHKDLVEGVTRFHLIGQRSETLTILLLAGEAVRIAG
jgi:hypothetical protein